MAEKKPTETPMMKQFFAVKAEHPEALLLFRCGDFYETYGDDALIASKVLGIVLTKRSNAAPDAIPMAGFLVINGALSGGGFGLGAAGTQGQDHDQSQEHCDDLLCVLHYFSS